MKPVVGITGGIASGKSTVAKMFGELGIPVVDADELAREVVEPGTPGLAQIVNEFGEGVLNAEGALNRKAVADIVFEDELARKKLNGIMHPLIGAAGAQKLAALQDDPAPYVLYEAALLVETGSHTAFPALVVVSAARETQKARVVSRDASSAAEAEARLDAQLPLAEKEAAADYVIKNDASLEETRSQVKAVHEKLVRRFSEEASP